MQRSNMRAVVLNIAMIWRRDDQRLVLPHIESLMESREGSKEAISISYNLTDRMIQAIP